MTGPDETPQLDQIGYDALIGDIFGLNIRGLKSLWISIKNPRAYYRSALSLDWQDKFTPAFRLWFTLIALTFFFQFFWAGANSATIENTMSQIDASTLPDGVSTRGAALEISKWSFGFLPFTFIFCLFVLAAIFPFWGEKTNFVVRQRKIFITIIPGTLLAIAMTLSFGAIPAAYFWYFLTLSYAVTFFCDSITAYRGAYSGISRSGKLWRAISLATATLITSGFASILSSILGSLAIIIKYG